MAKTYEQEYLELQSAIISAEFSYRQQELALDNKPLFSKNYVDAVKTRYIHIAVAAGVIGLFLGAILNHIL